MLRVLFVSSRYPDRERPYLGQFVERSARGLAERAGFEVEIVAPLAVSPLPFALSARGRRIRRLPQSETWNGLRVHRPRYVGWPGAHRLDARSLAVVLPQALRGIRELFRFDVVAAQFFWGEGPGSVASARAQGVPVSVKGRGIDVDRWARFGRHRFADLTEADAFLAVSEALRERIAALGVPRERIAVHRTGVDPAIFAPGDRAAAKAALGLDGPVVLAAGNLVPNKNHALAVATVSRLPGVTLLIAGGGPERARLERQARRLGMADRVHLLGFVPNERMGGLYRAADATLHTSRREGLSNVWVESLACGTPVVTTRAGAAAELFEQARGCRVAVSNAEALAAALSETFRENAEPSGLASLVSGYTWEAHVSELASHLQSLCAAGVARAARP